MAPAVDAQGEPGNKAHQRTTSLT